MGLFDWVLKSVRMPKMYRDLRKSEGIRKGRELFRENTEDAPVIKEGVRKKYRLYKQNKKTNNQF